ncbi:hypothetical protein H0H93_016391 [Arthromyces matolae]|nr:hypothetical protein H0H93_016391 [Arthromyces matolae]
MDRLEALGHSLSQITMYDIKSAYNQAKNMVLNISEMEAKVQEATNEDPWGASSTLMTEIAQGTFSFQHFNEIMPAIYQRFMDKEARQWRQIYKALQLLEYLIKHGSERVVDDARSHLSTIKMLRSFHYIDDKGKDEGINVRNRAKEIVELLSDVEAIRSERRKAKANKHKYTGIGNEGFGGGGFSGGGAGGSRYGGFGSDELGSGSAGGRYGSDYGAYSGNGGSSSFRDDARRGGFEEYDAGDDEDIGPKASPRPNPTNNGRSSTTRKASAPVPAPVVAPAPVEDLLGAFGDDDTFGSTTSGPAPLTGNNKALPAVNAPVAIDDDDFADFQAAPTQTTPAPAAPARAPPAAAVKPNLMELLASTPSTTYNAPRPAQQPLYQQPSYQQPVFGAGNATATGFGGMHRPTQSISSQPQFSAAPIQAQPLFGGAPLAPSLTAQAPAPVPAATPAATKSSSLGGGAFDDLWSMSLGASNKPTTTAGQNKSIKDLEKEKTMAGLWGNQPKSSYGAGGAKPATGGSQPPAASSSADDWML